MSILSTIFKMKRWIKTDEGYKPCSEWQKASEVEFDSGSNAETTLGAINGITSSLNTNNDNYALSAAGGYNLQSQVTELNTNLTNKEMLITTGNYVSVNYIKRAGLVSLICQSVPKNNVPKNEWTVIATMPKSYRPMINTPFNAYFGTIIIIGYVYTNGNIVIYSTETLSTGGNGINFNVIYPNN